MNREQQRNGVIKRRIEEAAEAILEYGDVKVDEQANGESHELEIRNDLRLVNRKQALNRLDFEDQAALHHVGEQEGWNQGKNNAENRDAVSEDWGPSRSDTASAK